MGSEGFLDKVREWWNSFLRVGGGSQISFWHISLNPLKQNVRNGANNQQRNLKAQKKVPTGAISRMRDKTGKQILK